MGGEQRTRFRGLRLHATRCYDAALPRALPAPMSHQSLANAYDAARVARPWALGMFGAIGKRRGAQAPI